MTADFTGRTFRLPPGLTERPRWIDPPAQAIEPELIIGGRTVLPDESERPWVISHPNRVGGAEDLSRLASLSIERRVPIFVRLDPYLLDDGELPLPLQPLVEWEVSTPALRRLAGRRMRLAADFLRRRMRQLASVRFLSESQAGGAVAVLLPVPARTVVQKLEEVGAEVVASGPWEGCAVISCGWWHTRAQLTAVADAIEAILLRRDPEPIPADRYHQIPDDLPRRWIDTIRSSDPKELV